MPISRFGILVLIITIGSLVSITLFNSYFWSTSNAQQIYQINEAFPNLSFNQPVGIYSANDETNRLFVVTQQGVIYVFENKKDVTNANVFLDISNQLIFVGEQGLLGLAFHPNFSNNGFFFVDYVAENPRRTVIARYSVSQTNPDQADNNSEKIILEVTQPYSNHNGGQITFGPDGYLYIALGDGGSGGDPLGNGQNLNTLLGSILRIDINTSEENKYTIPPDNPFADNLSGYKEEIFAYGLRNPWRFSFDPITGWLWVADVGQNRIEEINIVEKGKNYGWNIMEGSLCYSPQEGCNKEGLELPIWEYSHDLGISVTGGFVYRGSIFPELYGSYIYGDYGSGRIWELKYNGINEPSNTELVDTDLNIASFGIDSNNELYICAFDGKIYILISNINFLNIESPVQIPTEPTPDQNVEILVNITGLNGIREVTLSYSNDSIWYNITMNQNSGNTYSALIPAMPEQTLVQYKITAYDNLENFVIKNNLEYLVIPEFSTITLLLIFIIASTIANFLKKKKPPKNK